jgi:hypothetical protein
VVKFVKKRIRLLTSVRKTGQLLQYLIGRFFGIPKIFEKVEKCFPPNFKIKFPPRKPDTPNSPGPFWAPEFPRKTRFGLRPE